MTTSLLETISLLKGSLRPFRALVELETQLEDLELRARAIHQLEVDNKKTLQALAQAKAELAAIRGELAQAEADAKELKGKNAVRRKQVEDECRQIALEKSARIILDAEAKAEQTIKCADERASRQSQAVLEAKKELEETQQQTVCAKQELLRVTAQFEDMQKQLRSLLRG